MPPAGRSFDGAQHILIRLSNCRMEYFVEQPDHSEIANFFYLSPAGTLPLRLRYLNFLSLTSRKFRTSIRLN